MFLKDHFKAILIMLLFAVSAAAYPRPAKAIFGIGDISIDIQDAATQLMREIASSLLQKANEKYTKNFVAKGLQKFQINDYLSYTQRLANTVYLSKTLVNENPLQAYAITQIASQISDGGQTKNNPILTLAGTSGDYGVSINGSGAVSVPYDSTLGITAIDLATAINSDPKLSTLVKATSKGAYVTLEGLTTAKLAIKPAATGGDSRIVLGSTYDAIKQIFTKQSRDSFNPNVLLQKTTPEDKSDYMDRLTDVMSTTPQSRELAALDQSQTKLAFAQSAASNEVASGNGYKGSETCATKRFGDSNYSTLDCAINNPSSYVSDQISTKIQGLYNEQTSTTGYFATFIHMLGQTASKALGDKLFAPGGLLDSTFNPAPQNFLPTQQVDARAAGKPKTTLYEDIYGAGDQQYQFNSGIYNPSSYSADYSSGQ